MGPTAPSFERRVGYHLSEVETLVVQNLEALRNMFPVINISGNVPAGCRIVLAPEAAYSPDGQLADVGRRRINADLVLQMLHDSTNDGTKREMTEADGKQMSEWTGSISDQDGRTHRFIMKEEHFTRAGHKGIAIKAHARPLPNPENSARLSLPRRLLLALGRHTIQ